MAAMDTSYNYNDLAGLHNITKRSNENEAEALKDVARQFESMFVKMMLKSMRDANAVFEEDGIFNSYESKFYRQMFDDQLALSLSQGEGIGLAENIYRQLSQQFNIKAEDNKPDQWLPIRQNHLPTIKPLSSVDGNLDDSLAKQDALAITLDLMGDKENQETPPNVVNLFGQHNIKSDLPGQPIIPATLDRDHKIHVNPEDKQVLSANSNPINHDHIKAQVAEYRSSDIAQKSRPSLSIVESAQTQNSEAQNKVEHRAVTKKSAFSSPEEFVEVLWPVAQQVGRAMGVNPKAIMAQAALETGWGRHIIHQADGQNSYNLFGIKADQRWNGEQARVSTLEYRNGVAKKEVAPFRAYQSYEHSLKDYSQFITNSSRYTQAVKNGDSIKAYSEGLQSGGYATDPQYAKKIQLIADGDVLKQAIASAEQQSNRG